jgi:hypothetical protein
MPYLDYHVDKQLAQKHSRGRKCQSENAYRLYWSTYLRAVTDRPLPLQSTSQVRKCLCRLLNSLQRWRSKRVSSDKRVGEGESRTHPLISKQGDI